MASEQPSYMEPELQAYYKCLAELKMRVPANFSHPSLNVERLRQLCQTADQYLSAKTRGDQEQVIYAAKFKHFTHLFFADEKLDLESKYKQGAKVNYVGHRPAKKSGGSSRRGRGSAYAVYKFRLEDQGMEELIQYAKVDIGGMTDYKLLELSQHLFKLYNLLEKIAQGYTANPNRKLMHEALISAKELHKFLPQHLHRANFAVPEMPDPFLVLKPEFENKSMDERLEIFVKNLLIVHENVAIMNEEEAHEFSQYIYEKYGQMAEHVQEEKQDKEKNVEFSGQKSDFSRKKKALMAQLKVTVQREQQQAGDQPIVHAETSSLMAKLKETVEREQQEGQLPSPGAGIARMMAQLREQQREQHEEQPRVQAETSRRFHSQPTKIIENLLARPYQPPKSG